MIWADDSHPAATHPTLLTREGCARLNITLCRHNTDVPPRQGSDEAKGAAALPSLPSPPHQPVTLPTTFR
ncbi:hypothetical protein E2C01_007278 [Portunus trituberculatus]|uniref:Uncharacterized protein n=1 Tax=Portunus trituberculatus TaxID=210409 RepID=A0A5B7CYJ5_PORTR|nr:hypothetical protein [Portunus trituberculatus]